MQSALQNIPNNPLPRFHDLFLFALLHLPRLDLLRHALRQSITHMLGLDRARRLPNRLLQDARLWEFSADTVLRDVKAKRLLEHQHLKRLYREIGAKIAEMFLLISLFAAPVELVDLL